MCNAIYIIAYHGSRENADVRQKRSDNQSAQIDWWLNYDDKIRHLSEAYVSVPIHRSQPNHSYRKGKSPNCSKGEWPDTGGNARHPITPGPNRGLEAGGTATP